MMFNALVEVLETTGGGGQYWEPIAAFNVERAAMAYAAECKHTNPHRQYRTRKFTLRDLDKMRRAWAA
jgi:hypothetical protein